MQKIFGFSYDELSWAEQGWVELLNESASAGLQSLFCKLCRKLENKHSSTRLDTTWLNQNHVWCLTMISKAQLISFSFCPNTQSRAWSLCFLSFTDNCFARWLYSSFVSASFDSRHRAAPNRVRVLRRDKTRLVKRSKQSDTKHKQTRPTEEWVPRVVDAQHQQNR